MRMSWRETGAEDDEDATDEEAGAALLLLVLLLAGGATTVTVGFVTVFESNVTAVCASSAVRASVQDNRCLVQYISIEDGCRSKCCLPSNLPKDVSGLRTATQDNFHTGTYGEILRYLKIQTSFAPPERVTSVGIVTPVLHL